MKTFLIFILNMCYICCFGQQNSIDIEINKQFFGEKGILASIYEFWNSSSFRSPGERLNYGIIINADSNTEYINIKEIKDAIDYAFFEIEEIEAIRGIPELPIYKLSEDTLFFIIQDIIDDDDETKENFLIVQKLNITSKDSIIAIRSDDVILYRYTIDGARKKYTVLNTKIDASGKIPISIKKIIKLNENNEIANQIDSIIGAFWERHKEQKRNNKSYLRSDYVSLNEAIFSEYIKEEIKKIASTRVTFHVQNFLTRFLGNDSTVFYDLIPIERKEVFRNDIIATDRNQSNDISKNENYSLYRINSSEKKHKVCSISPFSHWATIKDNKLYELFMAYISDKYYADLYWPLIKIFGNNLGEKIYYDITRYFYGFTTALTIQDFVWINEFYHDIAIRNYFPGISDPEFGKRVIAIGDSAIVEGYKTLFKKGYEIFVTLNEGTSNSQEERISTVWLHSNVASQMSLGAIGLDTTASNNLNNMPAFFLKLNLEQKWHTFRRKDQEICLEDTTQVDFILLCLNLMRLEMWLKDGKYNETCVFILESYLQDLYKDMYIVEKIRFKEKYSLLNEYLEENIRILNELPIFTLEQEIFLRYPDRYLKFYKTAIDCLSSPARFAKVAVDVQNFINSDFRKQVHNRRFMFNVCYLKILTQFTYDKNNKSISIIPEKGSVIYNLIRRKMVINN